MTLGRTLVGLALVAIVAGTALTASLLTSSGAGSEAAHHAGTVASYVLVAAALTVVSLALRWVRWNNLVRRGGARLPTRDGAKLYAATVPAIATPFYVGELVRAAVLARRQPGLGWRLAIVWAIERLGDVMAAITIWAALGTDPWLVPVTLAGWVVAHFALAAIAGPDDHTLSSPGAVAITMALSLGAWAMPGIALVLVGHGFGSPAALHGLFYRATVLGGLTGSPLGIGVTGVLLIHGLRHAGMSSRDATLAVATFRAGTTWFAVVGGLAALVAWRKSVFGPPKSISHFDHIAGWYGTEIPAATRDRLVGRKAALIDPPAGGRGLDLGCGQGWYAASLEHRGYEIVGCDASFAQVSHGASHLRLTVADGGALPYTDGAFSFVYAINVLHHIADPAARQRTLDEVMRVLEPGGSFFLQEMNTTNPFFRFYMGYVFPLVHRIDEGTEQWIHPRRLPSVAGATWSDDVDYITFLPEFASPRLVRLLGPFEKRLERSRARAWSAHYSARLVKQPLPE